MTAATFSLTNTTATARSSRAVPPDRRTVARPTKGNHRMALDVIAVMALAGAMAVLAVLAVLVTTLLTLPFPSGPDLGRLLLDGRLLVAPYP